MLNSKKLSYAAAFLTLPVSLIFYIFFAVRSLERVDSAAKMLFIGGIFALFTFLCVFYFVAKRKLYNLPAVAFLAFAVMLAVTLRLAMFDFISTDYAKYLDIWTDAMREQPGAGGLALNISDYNMPYLYFLEIIAKFIPERLALYMTKTVSVAFEFLLAYYIMQLITLKSELKKHSYAVYCAALFMPAFILDGAYWSQCDIIYGAFAAGFIYYALTNRSALSAIFFALSFSFKLQAVFIAPLIIVFLFVRKMRPVHLLYIPAVYILLLIPAVLAGKPFGEALLVYANQAAEYPVLYINAPVIYQFLNEADYSTFKTVGIMLAGVFVAAVLFLLYRYKNSLNNSALIICAFVFALGLPLLLPCMHERYFFLADVFCLALPFINKKLWFVPVCVSYVSFRSYSDFLLMSDNINFKALTVINIAVLAAVLYALYALLNKNETVLNGGGKN